MAAPKPEESNISVGIRVRPPNAKEQRHDEQIAWDCMSGTKICELQNRTGELRTWEFDAVFSPEASTTDVYERLAMPVVDGVLDGISGSLLAYGQTSSGKTHTLIGEQHEPGLAILAVHDVFAAIMEKPNAADWVVEISFVELYNEKIFDLLEPTSTDLRIVEDAVLGTTVRGMVRERVQSPTRALELLAIGSANRAVAATAANQRSSRSHVLFSLRVTSAPRNGSRTTAVLHVVDLAGSERVRKTGAEGARLTESRRINSSLLALGNVVQALARASQERAAPSHVPYRDSKLTRLLSSALGGNSRTAFVCTLSPTTSNASESASTLQFAARARSVRQTASKVVLADETDSAALAAAQQQILRLRAALDAARQDKEAAIAAAVAETSTAYQTELDLVRERLAAHDEAWLATAVHAVAGCAKLESAEATLTTLLRAILGELPIAECPSAVRAGAVHVDRADMQELLAWLQSPAGSVDIEEWPQLLRMYHPGNLTQALLALQAAMSQTETARSAEAASSQRAADAAQQQLHSLQRQLADTRDAERQARQQAGVAEAELAEAHRAQQAASAAADAASAEAEQAQQSAAAENAALRQDLDQVSVERDSLSDQLQRLLADLAAERAARESAQQAAEVASELQASLQADIRRTRLRIEAQSPYSSAFSGATKPSWGSPVGQVRWVQHTGPMPAMSPSSSPHTRQPFPGVLRHTSEDSMRSASTSASASFSTGSSTPPGQLQQQQQQQQQLRPPSATSSSDAGMPSSAPDVAALEAAHNSIAAALQARVQELEAELSSAHRAMADAAAQLEAAHSRQGQTSEQLHSARQQLAQARAETGASQQQLAAASKEMDAQRAQCVQQTQQLAAAEDLAQALRAELRAAQHERDALARNAEQAESQQRDAHAQLQRLRHEQEASAAKLERAQAELQRAAELREAIDAELQRVSQELVSEREQHAAARSACTTLQVRYEDQSRLLAIAERRVTALRKDLTDSQQTAVVLHDIICSVPAKVVLEQSARLHSDVAAWLPTASPFLPSQASTGSPR